MKNITLRKLEEVTKGRVFGGERLMDLEISSIITDSRKVKDDSLFICIKGERSDGHDFAPRAIENGALAVVSEKEMPRFPGAYLLVDSTFEAAKDIAAFYRENLDAQFIGITGSVGKTSTKEFISEVLSRKYRVHKTAGNLNNEWGVPYTIFAMKESAQIAIIEMGTNHFGEIERLGRIVKPDMAVITNIGQSHLENFGTREGVFKEKTSMFKYLANDGKIILNGDDDLLSRLRSVRGITPKFFGLGKDVDLCAENIKLKGLEGSEFDIVLREGGAKMAMRVDMPVPGSKMIYNALAAYLVGTEYGLSPLMIKDAIENLSTMVGRNNIIKTDEYVVLDDCYNASPASMEAAIDILKMANERKVAILGDMLELGEDSGKFHYQVGKYAADAGIDIIICIGSLSEKTYMGAKMNSDKRAEYFSDIISCMNALPNILHSGDNILVKASNSMNFKEIVDFLTK